MLTQRTEEFKNRFSDNLFNVAGGQTVYTQS